MLMILYETDLHWDEVWMKRRTVRVKWVIYHRLKSGHLVASGRLFHSPHAQP